LPMRACSCMNCVCSPTLVELMWYLGAFSICGMHFRGIQLRGALVWDVLASVSISCRRPCSLASICSRICCGGSKVGLLALVPDLSLAVTLLYEGVSPLLCAHGRGTRPVRVRTTVAGFRGRGECFGVQSAALMAECQGFPSPNFHWISTITGSYLSLMRSYCFSSKHSL
jgi:hypothetical protein